MTRHPARTTAAALGAGVLLALGLSACSGDGGGGDVEELCSTNAELQTTFDDIDPNDPQAVSDELADVAEQLEGVDAPEAISEEWQTLSDAVGDMRDGFGELAEMDPSEDGFMDRLTEISEASSTDEVREAGAAVQGWVDENCEA